MIASLPMYDWPETSKYIDLFWSRFAAQLQPHCESAPTQLSRTDVHEQWQRDDMLLSQTCVYPLVTKLPKSTVVVGTPMFDVELNEGGTYASVLLVANRDTRKQLADFAGSTLAYNGVDSQSGFNALKSMLVDQNLLTQSKPTFFAHSVCTGSHRTSIAAVAAGDAHICAIDPVSWAMAQRYDEHARQVSVLAHTAFAPALPLVTAAASVPAALNESEWRNIVMQAFDAAIDDSAREHLLFSGITYIPKDEYLQLPISNLDMITV